MARGQAQRPSAELVRERSGLWAVKITTGSRLFNFARPGGGQKVIYDRPESVPRQLKEHVVPDLINQARQRNLCGE